MTRIEQLPDERASDEVQALYQSLKKKIGRVPNVYRVYAHSPTALRANLALEDILAQGELSEAEAEIIALVVSETNGCAYCLAAHTAIGKMQGLTEARLMDIRRGKHPAPKQQALINFTRAVLDNRGHVAEEDLRAFLAVGYTSGAVVEVVGHIAKNIFNNYTNSIAGTDLDFPAAKPV